MSRNLPLAAALLTILLSGCAQQARDPTPETVVTGRTSGFLCGRQSVSFTAMGTEALLVVGEQRLALTQARAASGARYVGAGGVEFWTHGDEALLTLDGEQQPTCVASDRLAGTWTTEVEGHRAQLRFLENGVLAASAGCNRLRGAYDLASPGRISFGTLVATRMACDGLMDAERRLGELISERDYTLRFEGEGAAVLEDADARIELERAVPAGAPP